jgi:YD repeat-containing protein
LAASTSNDNSAENGTGRLIAMRDVSGRTEYSYDLRGNLTGEIRLIDALECTECVGAEDEPQCGLGCPVSGCIVQNPEFEEMPEQLMEKYHSLHG